MPSPQQRQRAEDPAGILLHGFTGAPASWDPVRADLPAAASWRALPLPGHAGHPARPDLAFDSIGEQLAREAMLDGPRPWIGYSLGARLCCAVLAARPDVVSGLLLIGVNPGLTSDEARAEREGWEAGWLARMDQGLEAFVAAWEALPLFSSQDDLGAESRQRQAALRRCHDIEGLRLAFDRLGLSRMPDYRPLLQSARVPVWLVTGERDDTFCRLAAELTPSLERGQHRIVAAAGHNPVLEQPRAVAEQIEAFASIASPTTGAPR